jgi:hypothetical protein
LRKFNDARQWWFIPASAPNTPSLCITYGCYVRAAAISVFVSALVIWFQGHISRSSLFCFTSSRARAMGHSEPLKQRQLKVAFNSRAMTARYNLSPYNSSICLAETEATCMHTVFSCRSIEIVCSNLTQGKDACLRVFYAVLYKMHRKSAYLLCCIVQKAQEVYVSSVLSCTGCVGSLRILCAVLYRRHRKSAYLLCCLVQDA